MGDFGDTPEEAVANLREALKLLISVEPEKAEPLKKDTSILMTRIYL